MGDRKGLRDKTLVGLYSGPPVWYWSKKLYIKICLLKESSLINLKITFLKAITTLITN